MLDIGHSGESTHWFTRYWSGSIPRSAAGTCASVQFARSSS
jgi:hypothetical protein